MKPIDDNEFPSEEASDDVEEEDFDIDTEIKSRRRRKSLKRRTSGKEYGTMISFIAWIAFTIIWLFFFAGPHGLVENIAVIFVALLAIGAVNTLIWIPSHEGRKPKASAISGITWIVFLILWIVFFASGFGFYENIGIGLASLLIVGLLNIVLWVPSKGEGWGARISAVGGTGWLLFIVLWLPFANDFSDTVYAITFYQNVAIILASFLLMMIIVISPWFGKMQIEVNSVVEIGRKPKISVGLFWAWIAILVIWLWSFANGYSANQNVAVVLLSLAVFCGILLAMWLPWARKRGEGPESWFSIGLTFAWVIILTAWFWFFADGFDAYQNFAVFLVSLLLIAGVAAGAQWKKYRDFEALDWKD